MADALMSAEAFLPGDYLREELEARGWTETEFAEILGRPVQAISEILNGKKEITAETAVAFGEALGTSAELWLNLQASYRLHQVRADRAPVSDVVRRSRLRNLVPVRELQKRGWLPTTDDIQVLERAVCDLLAISTPDAEPSFAVAARRSNPETQFMPEQTAWIARVQRLGTGRAAVSYDAGRLSRFASELVHRVRTPADLGDLGSWLGECGVALVVELPLKSGKLDGVVLLSDTGQPIIGLSTRWDRMDIFIFTLLHEVAHLLLGHLEPGVVLVDEDIGGQGGSTNEAAANHQAGEWIIRGPVPISPPITMPKIIGVARELQMHPCFVVGRLQHDDRLDPGKFRRSIPQVRPFVRFG